MNRQRSVAPISVGICAAIIFAGLVLLWLIATPDRTGATTPVAPHKAEIVFENGGRIVSIRADGADRRILTRRNARVEPHPGPLGGQPVEDGYPSISPNGESLLFRRTVERIVKGSGRFDPSAVEWTVKLIVAKRDGTAARELVSVDNGAIHDPAWDPATGRIIYQRMISSGDKDRFRVVSIEPDGTDRKVLMERTRWMSGARLSPDGSRLLYTRGLGKSATVRMLELDSGADRIVASGSSGAWSPDGSRIAFVHGKSIRVAGLDGGDPRTIVKKVASPSGLDWSPDGERLAFASPRNFPGAGAEVADEIYSVSVEGAPCLTWLTNGSPASHSPSWGPEAERSTGHPYCGDGGRRALTEIVPSEQLRGDGPHLWAGPGVRGRLLSEVSSWGRGAVEYRYDDCSFYSPSKCRRPLVIQSIPQCDRISGDSVNFGGRVRSIGLRRSALLMTTMDRQLKGSMLITGRQLIGIGPSGFIQNRSGMPITMRDHLAAVRALRPVASSEPDRSALPRPAILRGDLRYLQRTSRVYRRTGSARATGMKLKTPASEVRKNLRLLAYLKVQGPIRSFTCKQSSGTREGR